MCLSIYTLTNVMKLCLAAQKVQKLIDDGTLAECFGKNRNDEAHECVTTFNQLAESAAAVLEEQKDVSPFLRYRREIMADTQTGKHLRDLVLNLAGGTNVDLAALFSTADTANCRIALELIATASRRAPDRDLCDQVSARSAQLREYEMARGMEVAA
ncbi:hypothetical protein [Propionivibrio limicola]|uniref:hypothetical protein n=1 Tax=Propionivibrio limicola TaxID=167645 RepID=UPI001292B0B8|nr:hypothetical protein [Propionivibrio limicola]